MGSDSPPPSLDTVQKTTEAIADFLRWVAKLIQRRDWFMLLVLVGVVLSIIFASAVGWLPLPPVLKPKLAAEQLFSLGLTVLLIFASALIIAVRTMPRPQTEAVDFKERKAIKGLRPFRSEDSEIFARLQRQRNIKECLEAIANPHFRFGILLGESGCGKTSFLQAALCPRVEPEASEQAIYIRFSDRNPLDTICEAFVENLPLLKEEVETVDFLDLLNLGLEAASKPLILIFDQFEQFFVHFRRKEDREPFINALRDWYISETPIKILVSIRGDLSDRFGRVAKKALSYSLAPQDVFRLEKFSLMKQQKVLRAIAETEKLQIDERFIAELAERELASREDGLISPVDVQILAWMVERQSADELRAFNRVAFQKLGGVEGLLSRFLSRTLEARITSAQRQAAVKVLLALTDLDRQVRAGVLIVAELQEKLKDTLKPEEVEEAALWLARGDVRLITSVEREGIDGYELAHERLIPALMGLAGKELSEADRANQLLDRRTNEWLGNQRHSRYLFGWQEPRLIERQKPYLVWGTNRRQKEQLLTQSKKRLYRAVWAMLIPVLLILGGLFWWYSPWGQLWQIRRDLAHFSTRVDDDKASEAAIAFAKDENLEQALEICDKEIQDPKTGAKALIGVAEVTEKLNQSQKAASLRKKAVPLLNKALIKARTLEDFNDKASALRAIAEAYIKLNQADKAAPLLAEALIKARTLEDSYSKADALSVIAEAIGKLNQADKAVPCSLEVLSTARTIEDSNDKADALSASAEAYIKLNQADKAAPLLAEALTTARTIEDSSDKASALRAIAKAYIKLNQADKAVPLLAEALTTARTIENSNNKAYALRAIAEAYIKLNQADKAAPLLAEALTTARTLEYSYSKAYALSVIAEAIGKLNQADKAVPLLAEVLSTARTIEDSSDKARALSASAEAIGKLNQADKAAPLLAEALTTARTIEDSSDKADALSAIAKAYIKLNQADKAVPLLAEALTTARTIENSNNKAYALRAIAEVYIQLKQADKAAPLLAKALTTARTIENSSDKADALKALMGNPSGKDLALRAIAEAQAKLSNWGQARKAVEICSTDECKVESLAKVLTVRAEQVHPELKELREEEE